MQYHDPFYCRHEKKIIKMTKIPPRHDYHVNERRSRRQVSSRFPATDMGDIPELVTIPSPISHHRKRRERFLNFIAELPSQSKQLTATPNTVTPLAFPPSSHRRIQTPQRMESSTSNYYKLMFEWMCDFSPDSAVRRSSRLSISSVN
jgi:hypothetical protein